MIYKYLIKQIEKQFADKTSNTNYFIYKQQCN